LACAVVGLAVALTTTSSTTILVPAGVTTPGRIGPISPGRYRFGPGPFAGAAVGTVDSVSASKFTMTTNTGQKLTVDEQSSTTYRKGTNSALANAVTRDARVLVLGSRSGSTIKAAQVVVSPSGAGFFVFPGFGPASAPSVG
jgi:hypothetical protein